MIVQTIPNIEYLTYAPKSEQDYDATLEALKAKGWVQYHTVPYDNKEQVFVAISATAFDGAPLFVSGYNGDPESRVGVDQNVGNIEDFVDTAESLLLSVHGDESGVRTAKGVAGLIFGDSSDSNTGLGALLRGILQ